MTTMPTIATAAHASASVALLFFLFEQWDYDIFWWILAICRSVHTDVLPGLFFPNRVFIQPSPSTAVHPSPCHSLSFNSGNARHIGLYFPSAGRCVFVCVRVHACVSLFPLLSYLFTTISDAPYSNINVSQPYVNITITQKSNISIYVYIEFKRNGHHFVNQL